MKRIITFLTLALLGTIINAQNNFFNELAKYEGEEYNVYRVTTQKDKQVFEVQEYLAEVTVVKDNYGKGIGINLKKGELAKDYDPRYDRIDHYIEPAYSRSSRYDKGAFLMIDGVLFELDYTNDNLSKFSCRYVYVPKSIAEKPKKGKKKKGKFGAFLKKAAKEFKSASKAPEFLKFVETEELLKTKIKDYVAKMQKKQTTLSNQDQKRWQEVIDMKKKAEQELAEYNRKFYASEAGQAQLKRLEENRNRDRARCRFTVKNTGSQHVYVINHLTPHNLSSGSLKEFDCNDKVYYSNNKGDKLRFIAGGSNSYNGKTVNVN